VCRRIESCCGAGRMRPSQHHRGTCTTTTKTSSSRTGCPAPSHGTRPTRPDLASACPFSARSAGEYSVDVAVGGRRHVDVAGRCDGHAVGRVGRTGRIRRHDARRRRTGGVDLEQSVPQEVGADTEATVVVEGDRVRAGGCGGGVRWPMCPARSWRRGR